jgi:hypothetical protein
MAGTQFSVIAYDFAGREDARLAPSSTSPGMSGYGAATAIHDAHKPSFPIVFVVLAAVALAIFWGE